MEAFTVFQQQKTMVTCVVYRETSIGGQCLLHIGLFAPVVPCFKGVTKIPTLSKSKEVERANYIVFEQDEREPSCGAEQTPFLFPIL